VIFMTKPKVEKINDKSIYYACPICGCIAEMRLDSARYYLRSHESVECESCQEKFKPCYVDIFQEFQKQEREKQDAIIVETGYHPDTQMMLRELILNMFRAKNMTKKEVKSQLRCDEEAFEKAFTKLISENYIIMKGASLSGEQLYGII
jgi:lysine/ornithine N-monooxygenase